MANPSKTLEDVISAAASTSPETKGLKSRIDMYIDACKALTTEVRQWLQPLADKGQIVFHNPISLPLNEQGFSYNADGLAFTVGSRYISLQPRGTWVIGAFGRVDMTAQPGGLVIFTLDKDFNWEVPQRGRTKITYKALDRDTFAEALDRAISSR